MPDHQLVWGLIYPLGLIGRHDEHDEDARTEWLRRSQVMIGLHVQIHLDLGLGHARPSRAAQLEIHLHAGVQVPATPDLHIPQGQIDAIVRFWPAAK